MGPVEDAQISAAPSRKLLLVRGIADFDTGVEAARSHFRRFLHDSMPLIRGSASSLSMGLLSMMTRAQAFHDGAIVMLRANDPFSTNALIRSYAENAAALVWIAQKPQDSGRLAFAAGQNEKLVVGRLIDEARKHYPGFKLLYQRLSEYTHPVASSFHSAWHPSGEGDGRVQWSSSPRFKTQDGPLWALLWLMEITDVHADIWPTLYATAVSLDEQSVVQLGDPGYDAGSSDDH